MCRSRLALPVRLELNRVLHDIQSFSIFRRSIGSCFLPFRWPYASHGICPILQQQLRQLARRRANFVFLAGICARKGAFTG